MRSVHVSSRGSRGSRGSERLGPAAARDGLRPPRREAMSCIPHPRSLVPPSQRSVGGRPVPARDYPGSEYIPPHIPHPRDLVPPAPPPPAYSHPGSEYEYAPPPVPHPRDLVPPVALNHQVQGWQDFTPPPIPHPRDLVAGARVDYARSTSSFDSAPSIQFSELGPWRTPRVLAGGDHSPHVLLQAPGYDHDVFAAPLGEVFDHCVERQLELEYECDGTETDKTRHACREAGVGHPSRLPEFNRREWSADPFYGWRTQERSAVVDVPAEEIERARWEAAHSAGLASFGPPERPPRRGDREPAAGSFARPLSGPPASSQAKLLEGAAAEGGAETSIATLFGGLLALAGSNNPALSGEAAATATAPPGILGSLLSMGRGVAPDAPQTAASASGDAMSARSGPVPTTLPPGSRSGPVPTTLPPASAKQSAPGSGKQSTRAAGAASGGDAGASWRRGCSLSTISAVTLCLPPDPGRLPSPIPLVSPGRRSPIPVEAFVKHNKQKQQTGGGLCSRRGPSTRSCPDCRRTSRLSENVAAHVARVEVQVSWLSHTKVAQS